LFCLLSVAFAITAPPCNSTSPGTPIAAPIIPFYKYSYNIPTAGTPQGSVFVTIDNYAVQATQYLWFRASSDATTAEGASLHIKLTVNRVGVTSDPDLGVCNPIGGSCNLAIGTNSTQLNFTQNGDEVWFTFFPKCSTCKSSVEFSFETAWSNDSTGTAYPAIPMMDNLRSMVFTKGEGGWITFYHNFVSFTQVWASLVYDSSHDSNSEVVLYWSADVPPNLTNNSLKYPLQGIQPGNYLQQDPFMTNSTGGLFYLGLFVKKAAYSLSNPQFTLKVGFNQVPCSSAAGLQISSLVWVLMSVVLWFSRN